MFCHSCGAQIEDHSNNCPSCGASQGRSPDAPDPSMHNGARAYNPAWQAQTPAATYLVPSILVTLFCCQIFGIVAIVYSAIAMGKNSSGDYQGAEKAAGTAKMWCWLGFGIGLVVMLLYAALMIAGAAASSGSYP
jgi:Interferon-induced transmembrane protein/zinc-ribbon domain